MRDMPLNKKPEIYERVSGGPFNNRLDGGLATATSLFSKQKNIYVQKQLTLDDTLRTFEIVHNLGYIPYALGIYKFTDKTNYRIIGDYVARDSIDSGHLWINNVTDNVIEVGYKISSVDTSAIIDMNLYLLRNRFEA